MDRRALVGQLRGAGARAVLLAMIGSAAAGAQSAPPGLPVQAAMQHVDFHVDATIVLRMSHLRGQLLPRRAGTPVIFDDKNSFILAIDSARISVSARAMADLLNRYVFGYPGAPLRGLSITVEGRQLKQRGRMNGMPFSILSDVRTTAAGEIRLTPVRIKAFGVPVTSVMRLLGMRLARMLDLRKAHGIRVEGNDLVIDPTAILPPPLTRGHLAAIELHDSTMVQIFRPARGPALPPLAPPDSTARNYMYFREGSLRFGVLTMTPADLLIVDGDPSDPFEFFLDRYLDQLVAGFSRNTRSGGLITTMPDLGGSGQWSVVSSPRPGGTPPP